MCGAGWGVWSALRGHGTELELLAKRPGAVPWLAAAVASDAFGLLFGAAAWRYVLASLGSSLGCRVTAGVFSAALLGKYLPGPAVNVAASVHMGRRAGVPAARMMGTYLLNSLVLLVTAAAVGMFAAPSLPGGRVLLLIPVLLLGAALMWRPGLVVALAKFVGRTLHRPMSTLHVEARCLRVAILLECASWLVWGLHLWFIAQVLGADGTTVPFVCVGGFALAAAAGALALVVPDGAGVRELVLIAVLSTVIPTPQAAAAALASRACCIVTEVVGAALALLMTHLPGARPLEEAAGRPIPNAPESRVSAAERR
ncbi:lysylphosphatidylglycerol synthase domain-containing protein [Actinoallomurus sp. NBC_01490]|uniref:lysylphosphatidylglycerol synthase domain-containing protein n=1 Tax=Actinoallomurus sp. NBC_01490 TaxID=2903557 RepID=UPI002E3749D8|nr:lysylphosphatidylglycerol synthase domain-containing protein [Actinoallomurus sp. NBC_01490]